ncbi:MAG: FAD-dependent oxidoreductase [Chitinophagaceae bacterium]
MLQPWRNGTVIRIENETDSTRRFWIQVDELDNFNFIPGQFVTLDLPIHEKMNKRWRSYSIASWPDGTNVFELVIVLLEDGLGTNYLFNKITVGSSITLRGPQGVFVLPAPLEKDIYLICTGTGIAPFRSMAHFIYLNNVVHKNIYLIFGCRKMADCLYRTELNDLSDKISSFHYIPTFSREEPGNYRTGYVHAAYEEICRSKIKPLEDGSAGSITPALFYLCGWKNMIDEAKQRILALGYERKSIHQELYG